MEARCEGEQARGLREQSFVYGLYVGMGGISWIGYCDGPTLTILDFFPFRLIFFLVEGIIFPFASTISSPQSINKGNYTGYSK
jgi:hypothetical protein